MHPLWDNINTCDLPVVIALLTSFEATFVLERIMALHTEWTNMTPAATHSMRTLAI
jgi:hypothetical protein